MKTRVVVTGMGAITPIGNDVESFWQGLKDKTVGIGPITYFDTTDYKCKLAAEVKGFDPKQYMDAKRPAVWRHFHSLRWLHPRKPWSSPVLIWRRRILTA